MCGIDWIFFVFFGGEALGVCSSTALTDFALCRPLLSTPMNGRSVAVQSVFYRSRRGNSSQALP